MAIAPENEQLQAVRSTVQQVDASIYFLQPSPLFGEEKPYAFRYGLQNETIPQTNMKMYEVPGITISNIRGREHEFRLETHGFEVMRLESQLERKDFFDDEKLPLYFSELENILTKRLGAASAKVFRHGIRQRDPDFPVSTGKKYQYDQPTSVAHVDTTPEEMLNEVQRQGGTISERCTEWINVWRPLRGPLNDWPLTLCDAATVIPAADFESADLLYPDLATENFQIYHNARHMWYYLSDHEPEELIVFKQASTSNASTCGEF